MVAIFYFTLFQARLCTESVLATSLSCVGGICSRFLAHYTHFRVEKREAPNLWTTLWLSPIRPFFRGRDLLRFVATPQQNGWQMRERTIPALRIMKGKELDHSVIKLNFDKLGQTYTFVLDPLYFTLFWWSREGSTNPGSIVGLLKFPSSRCNYGPRFADFYLME